MLTSTYLSASLALIAHAAFCGLPLLNKNIKLNYSSTLEGSRLTLACENDNIIMSNINASTTILNVTCHSDRNWVPNPADFIESCSTITTAPPSAPGIKKHSVHNIIISLESLQSRMDCQSVRHAVALLLDVMIFR